MSFPAVYRGVWVSGPVAPCGKRPGHEHEKKPRNNQNKHMSLSLFLSVSSLLSASWILSIYKRPCPFPVGRHPVLKGRGPSLRARNVARRRSRYVSDQRLGT